MLEDNATLHVFFYGAWTTSGCALRGRLSDSIRADFSPPIIWGINPAPGTVLHQPVLGLVWFDVADSGSGIDTLSQHATLNDTAVLYSTGRINGWGQSISVGETLTLHVQCADRDAGCGAHMRDTTWTYTVGGAGIASPAPPTTTNIRTLTLTASPNPFAREVTLHAGTRVDGPVRLEVLTVLGDRVRMLANAPRRAGTFDVRWDARDDLGRECPSGVYFARLRIGGEVRTVRLMLTR